MKKFLIGILALIAILYLLNPGLGVFEFLPDNIPFVGNVDETLAAYVLVSAFQYFRGKKIGLFGDDTAKLSLKK